VKLALDPPVDAMSSVEEVTGWIGHLANLRERYGDDPDAMAVILRAAASAHDLLDHAFDPPPPRPRLQLDDDDRL
jgi:hypothetical protein